MSFWSFGQSIKSAFNKVKSFAKPLLVKAKIGWSRAGQAGTYIHSKIVPKVKSVLSIGTAIQLISPYATAALAGVSTADQALGKALKAKAVIDKTAGRLGQYQGRIGQYSKKFQSQIKAKDYKGLAQTGEQAYFEGKKSYDFEKANVHQLRASFN